MEYKENGIRMHTVAGREIPECILIENGKLFTAKWIKEQESARCFLPENILRNMAGEIAENITIRTYTDGNSHDIKRKATKAEHDILFKLAYSALLGLNNGETNRQSPEAEDAIINAMEYACLLMLKEANSYDSLYCPLRSAVRFWREHSENEIMEKYGK